MDAHESCFLKVLAYEAFATTDIEDLAFDSVLWTKLRDQLGANHRWEAGFDVLLLVSSRDAIIILFQGVLREDAHHLFLL